jgi:hypothetical protein
MTIDRLADFRQVWIVDFEFTALPGQLPIPICMVAKEWRTGQIISLWQDELKELRRPSFSMRSDCLYVAFFASAEFSCHLALDWPMPAQVIDLYVENRNLTNGLRLIRGNGLLGALFHHGISSIEHQEKKDMRNLAKRGGPWTRNEKRSLLNYCQSDVVATSKLFDRLVPHLDLPRALLRGRYLNAVAQMEANGVPIDQETHDLLAQNAEAIRIDLIRNLGAEYGVFENGHFRLRLFEEYLRKERISWPKLPSGQLELSKDTFSYMALRNPKLENLKVLRSQLGKLQLQSLPLGSDGRNRCLLSPFSSKTSRNQPSSSDFVFCRARWIRRMVQPRPGRALLYIDYEQQEFGIAAALSGDISMKAAYQSGDPYLSFAIQAGAAPKDATRMTHEKIRNVFKQCALAMLYGMGPVSLAHRTGQSPSAARQLINTHRSLYSDYWDWSEGVISYAGLLGEIHTVFGWQLLVNHDTNPRTIQNFPMQANGAEILRLACCLLCETGIKVCAPIHDAVLIECAVDDLPEISHRSKSILIKASRIVLDGFELRVGENIIKYPQRMGGETDDEIWHIIQPTQSR